MVTEATAVVDGRTLRHQHRRPELLAAAVEYVLDHGFADLSLRPLASELGVTHATLIRHFISKDQLVAEVVDQVREDFLATLRVDEAVGGSVEFVSASWEKMRQPQERRQFRVLFELAARAPQYRDMTSDVAERMTDEWLLPLERRLVAEGRTTTEATAHATLVAAQIRGLQLDLLLSGDRDRVDAAFQVALDQLDQLRSRGGPSPS
ncbi:TetR/AcrR family transcriptional regulator [Aeromicrobium sp. P5_D10]